MRAFLIVVLMVGVANAGHGGGHRGGGGRATGTGSSPHSHAVRSYTTKSGRTVSAHHATNANHTQLDNYGTKGNVNPHNGKTGTRYADH